MPEQDYDYSYDENDAYLYSGTDVLVNNFGIKEGVRTFFRTA